MKDSFTLTTDLSRLALSSGSCAKSLPMNKDPNKRVVINLLLTKVAPHHLAKHNFRPDQLLVSGIDRGIFFAKVRRGLVESSLAIDQLPARMPILQVLQR